VENYHPQLIFENRLEQIIREQTAAASDGTQTFRSMVEAFASAVAAPTPTPAGGSIAALSGGLAAALGEMVCGISLKRQSLEAHHPQLRESQRRLSALRQRLLDNIDADAQSYAEVMGAFKLPKSTDSEKAARVQAIGTASKHATSVPLETAEMSAEVFEVISGLRDITISLAAPDLAVALDLTGTARRAAIENVRANLPAIKDQEFLSDVERRLQRLGGGAAEEFAT
jgi:methenyltetrahydrofolate cyclohydrolase